MSITSVPTKEKAKVTAISTVMTLANFFRKCCIYLHALPMGATVDDPEAA